MKGARLLHRAAETVDSRRRSYGDPARFFEAVAKRWSLTLGMRITAAQVILCQLDIKHERLCRDPKHPDSIIDTAGYAACLEEVRSQ
jgi:hypothetical protein